MKKITRNTLLFSIVLLSLSASAQDETIKNLQNEAGRAVEKDPNDTIPKTWKTGGLFNMNVNQGSLTNWAAGGDRYSFSLATIANLYAFYKKDKHIWDNTVDIAYGIVNTTSLGSRKADDRFDLLSKYGYQISPRGWYVGALFNFRTQFTKGFSYPDDGSKVLISNSFAPAYVLVSPTISYQPNENFSVSLSPATARWTIVTDELLSSQGAFGVDPGKKARTEFGAFATLGYKSNLTETISYAGRLDLFSNYLKNPQNIDIFMTNALLFKATRLITVSFSLDMIYDDDVNTVGKDGSVGGPKMQLKQLLGIGLSYRFSN